MIRQITKNIAFQLKTSSIKNYVHKSINMVFQSSRFVNNKRSMYFSTNKMRNPYETLGVSRNATIDQIKKAYRGIAQKYHPDKNSDPKAQTIFVQSKQAYQILSDQDKRRQFDNQTIGSSNQSRSYGNDKNPFDEFNDHIYKDKTRMHHQTYTQGSSKKRKGQDINRTIQLNFIEAVKGSQIKIQYQRKATCLSCHGNKCKPGTAPTRCLACGGSGTTVYRQNSIVMHLQCVRCKGIGLIIKYPCGDCKATGILSQTVKEFVKIPPGVEDGGSMTLKQKGNQSQNGPSGNLNLKFTVKKHPKFRKKAQNILTNQWVTISQAALGAKKKIQTIWGEKQVSIPAGVQDGAHITLKSQGIQTAFGKGDHIAITRIAIPKKLNQNQRRIFNELSKIEQQPQQHFDDSKNDNENDQKENDSSYMNKFKNMFK